MGVIASSDQDRTFTISISDGSTLDSTYYSLKSTVGVIPAGKFIGNFEVTTFAATDLPPKGAQLILSLESVENTEFLQGGATELTLGYIAQ